MSIKSWLNTKSFILVSSSLFNYIFTQDFNVTSHLAFHFPTEWIPSVCVTFLLASTVCMIYFNTCLPGASRMPSVSVPLPLDFWIFLVYTKLSTWVARVSIPNCALHKCHHLLSLSQKSLYNLYVSFKMSFLSPNCLYSTDNKKLRQLLED